MADYSFNLKKDSADIWNRIKAAEERAQKHLKECENAVDLYLLKHYKDARRLSTYPRHKNPLVVHIVETILGAITVNEPKLDIIPRDEDGRRNKKNALAALAYELSEADLQPHFRSVVKDLLLYGYGVMLNGWLYDDGERKTEGNRPDYAINQGVEDPTGLGTYGVEQTVVDDTEGAYKPFGLDELTGAVYFPPVEYDDPEEDRFFAKRISPKQFFISPEATRLTQDARYMGYWQDIPVEELKDNKALNQKVVKKVTANHTALETLYTSKDGTSEDCKGVRCYFYFERRRRLYCIYAKGCDEPLLVQKWGWKHGRYPFRFIHGIGDDDTFFGIALLLVVEDSQRWINKLRSTAELHVTRAVPKTFVRNVPPSPKQQRDMESPDYFGFVYQPPGQEIQFATPHQLSPDMYKQDSVAKQDMMIQSGQNQFEFLSPQGYRKSIPEVNAIAQGGGARAMDLSKSFETLWAGNAEDCLDLCMQYSEKTQRTLALLDATGNPQEFGPYTAAEIRGKYHFRVTAGSTAINFNSERLQALTYFQQTAGQLAGQAEPLAAMGVNPRAILQATMRFIPELADMEEEIFPPEAPMQMEQPVDPRIPPELLAMLEGEQAQLALPPGLGEEVFPSDPSIEEALATIDEPGAMA